MFVCSLRGHLDNDHRFFVSSWHHDLVSPQQSPFKYFRSSSLGLLNKQNSCDWVFEKDWCYDIKILQLRPISIEMSTTESQ
jgi:hypothetical protein